MRIMIIQTKGLVNGSGGCEKVVANLSDYFTENGHEVIIATNEKSDKNKLFFETKNKVEFYNIYDSNVCYKHKKTVEKYRGKSIVKKIIYRIKKISAQLYNFFTLKSKSHLFEHNLKLDSSLWYKFINKKEPDLIITMSIHCLTEVTFLQNYNIPIINSVNGRSDYDYTDILWYRSKQEMNILKNSYKKLSGIQVLFPNYIEFLPETCSAKIKVIPNQVRQFSDNEIVYHTNDKAEKRIIIIGRLDDGKNPMAAVRVFSKIAEEHASWTMYFFGEGYLKEALDKEIRKCNLQDRIFLKGRTKQVYKELKDSDIFVFPSKFEGFPLALTEAMSIGLPSIGFEFCSGVNQLIKHNENGFLAKDEEEMLKFLTILINDAELRNKFGKQAHNDMQQYNPEFVSQEWIKFVEEFGK